MDEYIGFDIDGKKRVTGGCPIESESVRVNRFGWGRIFFLFCHHLSPLPRFSDQSHQPQCTRPKHSENGPIFAS